MDLLIVNFRVRISLKTKGGFFRMTLDHEKMVFRVIGDFFFECLYVSFGKIETKGGAAETAE